MRKNLLFVLLLSTACFADEQPSDMNTPSESPRNYVGALAGYGITTQSASGTGSNFFTFAGRAGAGIYKDPFGGILSLGIYVGTISNSVTVSGVEVDTNFTSIMGEVGERRIYGTGLYGGGRFGIGLGSASVISGSTNVHGTSTSFTVAPYLGYEIDLPLHLSLVIDCSWMVIGGGQLNFTAINTQVPYNSASAILLQGGLVFRF